MSEFSQKTVVCSLSMPSSAILCAWVLSSSLLSLPVMPGSCGWRRVHVWLSSLCMSETLADLPQQIVLSFPSFIQFAGSFVV